MVRQHLSALILGIASAGCLDGDPNPVSNPIVGSSGVLGSSSGSSGGSGDTPTPISPGSVCSTASTQRIQLTFANNSADRTVNVFWVDFNCRESRFLTLSPGQSDVIQSFVSHPWRIRDAGTNALYKEFVPSGQNGTVVTFP